MAKYIDVDALKKEIDGKNRPEINDGSDEVEWLCKCIRTAPRCRCRAREERKVGTFRRRRMVLLLLRFCYRHRWQLGTPDGRNAV